MRPRGSLIATLCVGCVGAGVATAPTSAQADDVGTTGGRFGIVLAARDNLGDLGELYNLGFLWGFHAGLEQGLEDSEWSLGLGWTTLVRGYYFASDSSLVESTIDLTEVDLGVSVSRTVWVPGQHVLVSGGGVLLLSNLPIPPVDARRHLGWYAGLGFDRGAFGEWSWSVEARYSKLSDGLSNVNLVFGMTAGL